VSVLQLGGNLADAAVIACHAAMQRARVPRVTVTEVRLEDGWEEQGSEARTTELDVEVDDDVAASVALNDLCQAHLAPVTVSFAVIDGVPVVDPLLQEEECAQAIVRVAVNPKGRIVHLTSSTSSTPLEEASVSELSSAAFARAVAPKLFATVQQGIAVASKRVTEQEQRDLEMAKALMDKYNS
jgi:exosome complex RNA-binding protein Rrp42 (RNase PH superfamily)